MVLPRLVKANLIENYQNYGGEAKTGSVAFALGVLFLLPVLNLLQITLFPEA